LWRWLTLGTLGLTMLVSLGYVMAFISPSFLDGLLPVQQPTATPAAVLSLSTPTPTVARTATPMPTWTLVPSRTPWPTGTPSITPTPRHTPGPTPTFPPTWTTVPTLDTPPPTRSNFPFGLQNNEIIYTQYFFRSDCNWLGIAGLVFDKEGNPITGLPVAINGGGFQNRITYSGHAPDYGESGWEHFLDNQVKEGDFTIQLYNNRGEPISDQIQVHTRADCRGNLIMVIFEQNWDEYTP
jgi:hypothetical protein